MEAIGTHKAVRYKDFLLLGVMSVGAACGMVYEYLIAHYAGRILGSVDTAVYGMIGLMVVAMGIGAFYARTIKCPYTGFAWLESMIALVGGVAVVLMAGLFSLAYVLPLQLQQSFGLHESVELQGGIIFVANQLAEALPYIIGFILGLLIGMEIPLIARIREDVYKDRLKHNAGTVYGVDYIGAGVGAAIWVVVCLNQPIIYSATFTAILNLVLGSIFLAHFFPKVKGWRFLVGFKALVFMILIVILVNGNAWLNAFSNMLYLDNVEFSKNTRFQNLVVTERASGTNKPSVVGLYINGHLQFSSSDERIYHGMLIEPVMHASARHENVLVIGGGDGLAVRDILKWNPSTVTLVDLDPEMIELFKGEHTAATDYLNSRILELNKNSLNNSNVNVIYGDAFKVVEELAKKGLSYDSIIIDLPDPNHPDLNKLYSVYFYNKVSSLLSADGAMVVQSTSPYHSKNAFISIGKSINKAGLNVEQYHTNVPSFGQWGWTIATKAGKGPLARLKSIPKESFNHEYLSRDQIIGSFAFPVNFYDGLESIDINYLNTPTLYTYHSEGWRTNKGVYDAN